MFCRSLSDSCGKGWLWEEQTPVDEQKEAVLAKKGQEVLDKLGVVRFEWDSHGERLLIDDMVEDYLSKHGTIEEAVAALVRAQSVKCGTLWIYRGIRGFIASVMIPANVSSVFTMRRCA